MFGLVGVSADELTQEQKRRYGAVYCGICRKIRENASQLSRLGLSYDMAFLALLLGSLYEPEETVGDKSCILHPIRHRPWVESGCIEYAADMNVALAYYNALDDWHDDKKLTAKAVATIFENHIPRIREKYPRQCDAMERCIRQLRELEQNRCPNPDLPANTFGDLMGELLAYKEDLWSPTLRQMGHALGRFIYLADAAMDYRRDVKKGSYNPFAAMGVDDTKKWEQYLVLAMARCTDYYERLPLVQDKPLLDNILYSGVWIEVRRRLKSPGGTT